MKNERSLDLSNLALNLAFLSVLNFVLAIIGAVIVIIIFLIAGFNAPENHTIFIILAFWAFLEFKTILRIQRIAMTSLPVSSSTHSIHALELTITGFLFLYDSALPYLVLNDAGAYPEVKIMFSVFIGILVLCHISVLVVFQKRPDRWDVCTLAISSVFSIIAIK